MPHYESPRITELGSLSELTQNLLPSLRAMDGTLAAISAPMTSTTPPPPAPVATPEQPVQTQAVPSSSPVPTGADAPSVPPGQGEGPSIERGPGGGVGGEQQSNPSPQPGGGEGPAPTEAAPRTTAAGGDDGDLPFTGFPALVVGAVGAVTVGAGAALRRVSRRR